jgi:hypothetical protein
MWLLVLLAGLVAAAGGLWWLRVRWVNRQLGPGPGLRRAGDEPPSGGTGIESWKFPNDGSPL